MLASLTKTYGLAKIHLTTYAIPESTGRALRARRYKENLSKIKQAIREREICIPGFWATQTEAKEKLKKQQEADELRVLRYLANNEECHSASAQMLSNWGLDREQIRKVLGALEADRLLQTTFTNLVGATRFKIAKGDGLMHTKCPRCGSIDSWQHCVECYQLRLTTANVEQQWLANVRMVLKAVATESPAMPLAADQRWRESSPTGGRTSARGKLGSLSRKSDSQAGSRWILIGSHCGRIVQRPVGVPAAGDCHIKYETQQKTWQRKTTQ